MTNYYITHDGEGVVEIIESRSRPTNAIDGPFKTRVQALDKMNCQQVNLQRQAGRF